MDESSKETSGERQSQEPEAAKLTNEKPADEAGGKTPPSDAPAGVPAASAAPAQSGAVPAVSGDALPQAPAHGAAGESMLPVVWSPKLGGDEVSRSRGETSAFRSRRRRARVRRSAEGRSGCICRPWRGIVAASLRVAMVAVALAAAAAVGSFIGSLSATGVEHFWPAAATRAAPAHNAPQQARAGRRVGAESQSRCGDAWRERPVGQTRRAS